MNKKNNPLLFPLRSLKDSALTTLVSGQGAYVKDSYGNTYLDGISGLWNMPLGYSHLGIKKSIINQLNEIQFVNFLDNSNPTTENFAGKLLEITNNAFQKVMFTCSGSESIELAVKIARKYQRLKGFSSKYKLAVLDISYHGTTYAAMSASGMDSMNTIDCDPKVPGFIMLPSPICHCCLTKNMEEKCLNEIIQKIDEIFLMEGNNIAGVILEPIVASGGIVELPEKYLNHISNLCKTYDALLIFDEVVTGFGRTGAMFAYQDMKASPNVVCLSKGINNGYIPLGAVLIDSSICDLLELTDDYIKHFSTQNGNPIACAAGISTVEAIQKDGCINKVKHLGSILMDELRKKLLPHKNVIEIRGKGLMIGIALAENKNTKKQLSFKETLLFETETKRNGLITFSFFAEGFTSGLSLLPPFIINETDLNKIVSTLEVAFSKIEV